jgi:hypothetical protein
MKRQTEDGRGETVHLGDLGLPPQWRAWLLARADQEGGLARALRALVAEALLVEVFRAQYDQEVELRRRLLDAGHTHAEVRAFVVRWRRGETLKNLPISPPIAARVLHRGVLSRVPQIRPTPRVREEAR